MYVFVLVYMCVFLYVYVHLLFTLRPQPFTLLELSNAFRLAGKKFGSQAGIKKIKLIKTKKNENFKWENGNSRNKCSVKVGGVGIKGMMMTLPKIGALV